jgi:calmodulin
MRERVNPSIRDAEEIAKLGRDFRRLDGDGDGRMQFDEFRRFLAGLKANLSESECRTGFREIDSDHDGVIDFQEFLIWWHAA